MPDAARKGDQTKHTTALSGSACSEVKIGGNDAWRVGDVHSCSKMNHAPPPAPTGTAPIPHVGGAVLKGSFTVLIGSQPAARKDDMVIEPAAMPPTIPHPPGSPPEQHMPNNPITGGDSTVDIGDRPFGLLDPDILRRFCEEWKKLREDWAGSPGPPPKPPLTPAEREARMQQMLNNALGSAGAPPVAGITQTAAVGAQASYAPWAYQGQAANVVNLPAGTFTSATAPAGSMGATLIHEIRHAEQWFNNARYLAGQGHNAAQISQATGVSQNVAQAAQANPAGAATTAGQHGAMNNTQAYGGGSGHDSNVRNHQSQTYQAQPFSQADYNAALEAYYGLPNEKDAQDAENALKALCPEAH